MDKVKNCCVNKWEKKRDRRTKNLTSILIVVVNLISILSVKKIILTEWFVNLKGSERREKKYFLLSF